MIYIRLDAGHKVGMGHLFRMIELASIFKEKNYKVKFIIRENSVAENILVRKGFTCNVIKAHAGEEYIIKKSLSKGKPYLWIFDILDTEKDWILYLKKEKINVVCIDDIKGGLDEANVVINPIVGCWGDITYKVKNPLFSGPKYAILPRNINLYRKHRKIEDKRLKVAVAMGGSDTYGVTINIAHSLVKLTNNIDHVKFFLGPAFKHIEELKHILKNCTYNFFIKQFVKDLLKELDKMDVVICGGGVTLFEICAIGLPSLSFANEPHEKKTIAYFEHRNATYNVGLAQKTTTETLTKNLLKLLSDLDLLNELAMNGMKLSDGKGVYRVYKLIRRYGLL